MVQPRRVDPCTAQGTSADVGLLLVVGQRVVAERWLSMGRSCCDVPVLQQVHP
jgi:hypothetical protein